MDAALREGDDPEKMHELMAATLDEAIESIKQIQSNARESGDSADHAGQ